MYLCMCVFMICMYVSSCLSTYLFIGGEGRRDFTRRIPQTKEALNSIQEVKMGPILYTEGWGKK